MSGSKPSTGGQEALSDVFALSVFFAARGREPRDVMLAFETWVLAYHGTSKTSEERDRLEGSMRLLLQQMYEQGAKAPPSCPYCDEDVLPTDPQETMIAMGSKGLRKRWIHRECAARSVLGSVGHLEGRCSCHGGSNEDPPGMTKRQAAKAAFDLAQKRAAQKKETPP